MTLKSTAIAAVILIMLAGPTGQKALGQDGPGLHKVVVKEVIQTTKYTYLKVLDKMDEMWLAVPKMQAKPGETYYCRSGIEMTDFESKELGKKFKSVRFLESVSTTPELNAINQAVPMHSTPGQNMDSAKNVQYKAQVTSKREDISLQSIQNGITIAELYENIEKYKEKTIRIQGKVTRFNEAIMETNWVHIQDGTEYSGKYDLTATTDNVVQVGSIIIIEGKVTLAKDFGYGYSYEVLMEKAILVK